MAVGIGLRGQQKSLHAKLSLAQTRHACMYAGMTKSCKFCWEMHNDKRGKFTHHIPFRTRPERCFSMRAIATLISLAALIILKLIVILENNAITLFLLYTRSKILK